MSLVMAGLEESQVGERSQVWSRDACQVNEGGVLSRRGIRGPEGQMSLGDQISLVRVLLAVGTYLGQVPTSLGQDHVGGCSRGTEVQRGKGRGQE